MVLNWDCTFAFNCSSQGHSHDVAGYGKCQVIVTTVASMNLLLIIVIAASNLIDSDVSVV